MNRLHVYDGTTMRRTSMAASAVPTAANTGSGSLIGTRYYRYRYTTKSGSSTLRRGEPSPVLTHAPSGSGTGIVVTKGAAISEGETHWELEASLDNANFYIIATTAVATTTVTDSTAETSGYASFVLSEGIEDYATIGSARYLSTDGDRLIYAGNWSVESQASRVGWTPVLGASGVGNDERFETDTDPFQDLDTYENGVITGLSSTTIGAIWVFKQHAIYKLVRSGQRQASYTAIKYTDALGAIHGSVVSGLDAVGQPAIYFIDHDQGPCRLGYGGVKRCGEDIRSTWNSLNVDATKVVCSSIYYTKKKQVRWNIATGSSNTPDKCLVLDVSLSRDFDDGARKGWSEWTGNISKALSMVMFADNIEDDAARSLTLVPFICLEGLGLVHQCQG